MRYLMAFFILAAVVAGCSKSKENGDYRLTGAWEWTSELPAIYMSLIVSPETTGIHETISFTTSGSYSVVRNGNEVQHGRYTVGRERKYYNLKVKPIWFSSTLPSIDSNTFYYIEGDRLSFSRDYGGEQGTPYRFYQRR